MFLFRILQKIRKALLMNLFSYCRMILDLRFGMMLYLSNGVIVFGQKLIKD